MRRGAEIGYCFIGDGANFRYTFARRGDAIVGPYYIDESKRGQGLASKVIEICLSNYSPATGKAWDFIQHNNTASIKTSEKIGFDYYSDCKYSKYLRILNICEDDKGDERLYRMICKGEQRNK